jgi:hypothetical protein
MSKMIGTTIVAVAALACAAGAVAGRPNGNVGHEASGVPVVVADPAIVRLSGSASVTARGLAGRRLEVRLVGAAPSRGQGLAWKPAEAGSSRHLPDRGAGRGRATGRAVGELDAPCLRSGDPFPALVRQARRRGEMVGADRHRRCTIDRAQTLAPARLRPARSTTPPTARGRLLAGRTPGCRGSPRHVRHRRPQRLRRPLAPARSDVAALGKPAQAGFFRTAKIAPARDGVPRPRQPITCRNTEGRCGPAEFAPFGGVAAWSRAPPKTREQADPPRLREGR